MELSSTVDKPHCDSGTWGPLEHYGNLLTQQNDSFPESCTTHPSDAESSKEPLSLDLPRKFSGSVTFAMKRWIKLFAARCVTQAYV